MDLTDFFKSTITDLPKQRNDTGHDNFEEFIAEMNRQYLRIGAEPLGCRPNLQCNQNRVSPCC